MAETLSGGTGTDDAAPMQLAQQEDKLQEAQPPQSDTTSDLPDTGLRIGGRIDDASVADAPAPKTPAINRGYGDAIPEQVPTHKNQIVSKREWDAVRPEFERVADEKPGKAYALAEIFAAEGGMRWDPGKVAYAGLTEQGMWRARQGKPDLKDVKHGEHMTPANIADAYSGYLDAMASRYGGWDKIEALKDQNSISAIADTFFREDNTGAVMVKDATTNTLDQVPADKRAKAGLPAQLTDDDPPTKTIEVLQRLHELGLSSAFRDSLIERRNLHRKGEKERNERYR